MNRNPHAASYYAASINRPLEFASLAGEVDCDVCVVGAGFTGCSAALHLAERGYRVVLLEAERVGWGASGRNGGQISPGYAASQERLQAIVGVGDARRLWDLSVEAVQLIRDQVTRHQIECDLKPGNIQAAIKQRQAEELRDHLEELSSTCGYAAAEFLDAAQMREVIGSERYVAGLYDHGGGHLHPLNYVLGLAAAAHRAGAQVFEATRVLRVDRGTPLVAHAAGGQVRCRYLVYCCNAYLADLEPRLHSTLMPVGTYIIATEPLGDARAEALISNDACVQDINFVLDYFRLSADRRMLFGGGVSYSTLAPPNLTDHMRRRMLRVFPQLEHARIDYTWGGYVGITINRAPQVGRLAGDVYFAQGFSGHGVALTGLAGKLVAEAIAGTAERFDVFSRIPHQAFPGGRWLRTPGLVLAMLYYRIRDML